MKKIILPGFTVSQNEYFPEINMPLRLVKTHKSSDRIHPVHFHDFTEIGIVISGECRHLVEDDYHQIRKGDVIYVPRGASHGYADMNEFSIINMLFIQRRLPLPLLDFGNGKLAQKIFSFSGKKSAAEKLMSLNEEQFSDFITAADRIIAEEGALLPSYRFLLLARFMEILVILDRAYSPPDEFHSLSAIPAALEFLECNYRGKIDFDILARKLGMSRRSFFRHFRSASGTSPAAYLTSIRLRKVMELLRTTDMPISSIALECGFGDCFVMNRCFKKNIGVTPFMFRKQKDHDF